MYLVIRHKLSGQCFIIGRRTTELPGREPVKDWIKQPVTKVEAYWVPNWNEATYLVAGPNVDGRPNRSEVEKFILEASDDYEVVDRYKV